MHIDWMMTRKPFVARPDTTVREARHLLRSHRVSHLPVVGAAGDVVGMLSDGDLEVAETRSPPSAAPDLKVGAVMTPGPIVVSADAEVDEALDIMLECGVGALPVVDRAGQVVGIVSYGDVARALGALPA